MNCAESLELLSEYYEKSLDDARRAGVGTHLAKCLVCAEVFHDIELIVESSSVLRSYEGVVFPDENVLWQRIQQTTH